MSEPFLTTKDCETTEEFLDALSPRGDLFGAYGARRWLYRGHPDDEYELVPSALRDESKALRELVAGGFKTDREQTFGEMIALARFFKASDLIGLQLPEDSQVVRRIFERTSHEKLIWPPKHLFSLMAVAQHHGLPTRLLDWSYHPLKAAYFAASGAFEKEVRPRKLCVWAMSLWLYELPKSRAPIKLVTAPSSTNPNLRAQEGVFTMMRPSRPSDLAVDRRPLNVMIEEQIDSYSPLGRTSFFRITLPAENAEELLFELAREGVARANLFPDFYGVVNGLKEVERISRSEFYSPSL